MRESVHFEAGGPYPGLITDVITHTCGPLTTATCCFQPGEKDKNQQKPQRGLTVIYSGEMQVTEADLKKQI